MVEIVGGEGEFMFIPAREMRINFKGVFHFENLYKMMFDWLGAREFKHYPTKTENIEDYFQEYLLSNGAKNNWIWWRTIRKESDMFNYYIEVNIQNLVLTTKEVVHKGEKYKMNEGEITIFIKGILEVDPNKQWQSSSFMKKVFPLYKDKEFVAIIDDKEEDVCAYAGLLFERCKQYLNLMTSMPLQKPFHPELGYPQQ